MIPLEIKMNRIYFCKNLTRFSTRKTRIVELGFKCIIIFPESALFIPIIIMFELNISFTLNYLLLKMKCKKQQNELKALQIKNKQLRNQIGSLLKVLQSSQATWIAIKITNESGYPKNYFQIT